MAERFDQEFYSSAWRRVLPLGPDGIQPYVRTSLTSRRGGLQATLGRLIAISRAMAQGMIGFVRFAPIGMAKRPMLVAAGPRPLRLAHEAARPAPAAWCRSREA